MKKEKEALKIKSARPELAKEKAFKPQILFEDEHLLAIFKPRMMHTVTLLESDPLTLADIIAAYSPESLAASLDQREAGLVQRLDFYTSGVVLAAKKPEIWDALHQMMISSVVKKEYLALVQGALNQENFSVTFPLRQSKTGKKMKVDKRAGKAKGQMEAQTDLHQLAVYAVQDKVVSVVSAEAQRVRRHQIRVHLASIGSPLVGDLNYGATQRLSDFFRAGDFSDELGVELEGFFLHAKSVSFTHPVNGKELMLTAEAEYFKEVAAVLS